MTDIPPSDKNHDLKWDAMVGFASVTPPKISFNNSTIETIARTFENNVQRVKWMLLTPSLVGDLTIDIQRCFGYAEFQVTGTMIDPTYEMQDHPRNSEISNVARDIFNAMTQRNLLLRGTPQWSQYVLGALDRGTQPVRMLADSPAAVGLSAMLSSAITGTWTAFETMAGDLWESAVNVHPNGLSELKGRRNRLLKTAERQQPAEERDDSTNLKTLPLWQVQRHQFDLRNKMGTALKGQRRFDHLAGIREAYALAFFEMSDEIDEALRDDALDALNTVRNVIVHRSGVVDSQYERRSQHLNVPKAEIGQGISLDWRNRSGAATPSHHCIHQIVGSGR
jgi:hypothetical protein